MILVLVVAQVAQELLIKVNAGGAWCGSFRGGGGGGAGAVGANGTGSQVQWW
jgi:hypothetical protein